VSIKLKCDINGPCFKLKGAHYDEEKIAGMRRCGFCYQYLDKIYEKRYLNRERVKNRRMIKAAKTSARDIMTLSAMLVDLGPSPELIEKLTAAFSVFNENKYRWNPMGYRGYLP
jgi:hypothetical protein